VFGGLLFYQKGGEKMPKQSEHTAQESGLTVQQERFCYEYHVDFDGKRAAIDSGYSPSNAAQQASRLLTKANVQKFLQKIMSEKDDDLIATADEVLETLTRVLRRHEREHIVVTLKKRESKHDERGKKVIVDTETAEAFEIPAKLSDVTRAAELLGKAHGLYTDKVDHSGGVQINFSGENDLK